MQKLMAVGLLIILAGFALILAGSPSGSGGSFGGVIFLGPVPFAFGSGPAGWELALGSVVVGAVMILLFFVWERAGARASGQP